MNSFLVFGFALVSVFTNVFSIEPLALEFKNLLKAQFAPFGKWADA